MRYCFDVDGTLCTTNGLWYEGAEPKDEVIQLVNQLYSAGHQIIIFTGRGAETGVDWTALTSEQLRKWGVNYHRLLCSGKPAADVYVDDRGIHVDDFVRNYHASHHRS